MRLRSLPVAAIYAVLVVAATWPQARQMSTGVNDFGDPLLNSWALAWVAHAAVTNPAGIVDANIFHPERNTLAYSETLLLPGLLLAPLSWLGANPVLVHNVLLLGSLVLSGLTMFWLARGLTGHTGAAFVAGAVFALFPYRMEAFPKVQLALTWWWPLALLALHRLASAPGSRYALSLAAFVAAELYTCVYYGILGGVAIAVIAVALLVTAAAGTRRRLAAFLVLAALSAGAAMWPLVASYRAASLVVGERSLEEVERGSAQLDDYLRAHPEGWWHGDPAHPGVGEHRLFPGYAAPLLAVAALVPPVDGLVLGYVVLGGVAVDLSLGLNGPGYRWFYDLGWPLRALRVNARFAMVLGLALAVLSGFGIARLCRGRRQAVQLGIAGLAVATVFAEGRMRPIELSHLPDPAPAVYRWLATQPRGVVCEYPVGPLEGRAGPQDATYMYYSTLHWQPLVNGYSGFAPGSYRTLLAKLDRFPDDESVAYLRSRDVTYLLVHEPFYIQGDYAADVALLRARADLQFVGVFPWRGGGRTAVFRLK